MIRGKVSEKLAPYRRIAVWGAGSSGAQAVGHWLPKDKIVCLIESGTENAGLYRFGLEICTPDALADKSVDCIIICTDAYLEVFEWLAQANNTLPAFHVFDLLHDDTSGQSEIARLKTDIRVQKNSNWLDFLIEKPQIAVNLTYRFTRAVEGPVLLLPVYYLFRIIHSLVCVFFSISLPPTVSAGAGLVFQHYGSIVFHPRAKLGRFVKLYQGVTIGANDVGDVPVIGNHVIVYHGAGVIGKCRIGDHARIGAMALAIDLESNRPCTIFGQPAEVKRVYDVGSGD